MTESTEYFRPPHATSQRRDVIIFFANQGNMRKNIIQEPLPSKDINTYFPALKMTEFLPTRLSTSLAASKSNGALSPFRFSIILKYEERKQKFRIFRKNLETASIIRSLKRSNSADGAGSKEACQQKGRGGRAGCRCGFRAAGSFVGDIGTCRSGRPTDCYNRTDAVGSPQCRTANRT